MLHTIAVAAMMNITTGGFESHSGKPNDVAIDDLLEVEACLRDLLQSTSDPATLQRLFNLHREIEKYVAEVKPTPKK
jgi:hypothetical protein